MIFFQVKAYEAETARGARFSSFKENKLFVFDNE